jgi:hypothetical protein
MFTIWNSLKWRRTGQELQGVSLDSFNFVTLVITPIVSPEAAVVLDLHRRDASRQQVFTTFSPQALLGNVSHDLGKSLFPGKPF